MDIVCIGTVSSAHCDCCMKMFEYNKHVLCEKPLTINATHIKKLIETARSKKLFLMEVIVLYTVILVMKLLKFSFYTRNFHTTMLCTKVLFRYMQKFSNWIVTPKQCRFGILQ